MFNTLRYAKMLEEVGFSRDQAETSVKILVEIMEDKLASKQDLQDFRVASKQDLQDLRVASKQDLQDLRIEAQQAKTEVQYSITQLESKLNYSLKEMRTDLQQMELKLTIRMGTMLAASIAILTAIQKLT